MARSEHTRVSALLKDPFVANAFRRIDSDISGALVEPRRPSRVLAGGAAVRILEDA